MTGPEHYRTAEQLLEQADAWMDADRGWMATMPTSERLARRAADLTAAQVHATLAHAAATALSAPVDGLESGFTPDDWNAWRQAASAKGGEW